MKTLLTVGICLAIFFLVLWVVVGLAEAWNHVSGLYRRRELEILQQLEAHGESYGLELIKRSGGLLQRGRVYAMLDALEERGLVKSQVVPAQLGRSSVSRRMYRITDGGIRELKLAVPQS